MPYTRSRKNYKKKTPYAGKMRRSYRPSLSALVKKEIMKTAESKAKILANTEFNNGSTLTSPTAVIDLNWLAEGTEEDQRIGNMVQPTRIDLRGCVKSNHHSAMYHKIMVLEMNYQSDPLVDLLEDNNGVYAPATQDLTAIFARINTTKYKVLATRTLKTGLVSNQTDDFGGVSMFNINLPLKGKLFYEDALSFPQKRRMVMICISREANNDTALGHTVELTYNSKFYYKDI